MRQSLCLILLLLLGWLGSIGKATAAVWIEFYDGKRDAYQLIREGKRLPIAIYQDLQKGDRLSVDQPGISLWLKQDDGSTHVIRLRNSPYQIQDTGQAPGILDQLLSFAGEFLSIGMEDGSAKPHVVTTGSRGDETAPPIPLRFPLAPSRIARLVEGHRPLHLFWTGGAPPLQLRLLREDDNLPLLELSMRELTGNNVRRLTLPSLPLKAGTHVLELRDARRLTKIKLDVVAEETLPKPAQELGPNEEDPMRANLYAVWLASQGEAWMLEAYQRAKTIATEHPPARAFSHSLEAGRRPMAPAAQAKQTD